MFRHECHPMEHVSPSLRRGARCRLLPTVLALAGLLSLVGGQPLLAEPGLPASPPRNDCTPIPGHLECIDDHAGLIHGAVVHLPSSKLTCRAFRQVYLLRYEGKRSRAETREVVVAGVCEHTGLDGTLIRRWSTVPSTKHLSAGLWSSLAVTPPSPVVRLVKHNGGSRKSWVWTGYYLPQGWNLRSFGDATKPADFAFWSPLGNVQAWRQPPAGGESVESPLFAQPVSCTSGYIVCTPYLMILHPDPASSEVRVEMIGARRFFFYRTKKSKQYQYSSNLFKQVFTDPGNDGGTAEAAAAGVR